MDNLTDMMVLADKSGKIVRWGGVLVEIGGMLIIFFEWKVNYTRLAW